MLDFFSAPQKYVLIRYFQVDYIADSMDFNVFKINIVKKSSH